MLTFQLLFTTTYFLLSDGTHNAWVQFVALRRLVSSRHAIRYKAFFQGLIRLGEGLAHNWRLCSYDCFLLSWRYFFGPYPFCTQIRPRKMDLLNAFFHKISISKILFWSVYLVCATLLISRTYLSGVTAQSRFYLSMLMPPQRFSRVLLTRTRRGPRPWEMIFRGRGRDRGL